MSNSIEATRAAVLARMVCNAPDKKLGRTQVMKLFYFLQELKGAPLGYDFRLFTYGPFDSEVLSDLATACNLGTMVEKTVIYPRGYGYEITPGPNAAIHSQDLEQSDPKLASLIDEVVLEFGSLGAAELELRSTILFVDREFASIDQPTLLESIVERVRQIKPHFDDSTIRMRAVEINQKGYLQSLSTCLSPAF